MSFILVFPVLGIFLVLGNHFFLSSFKRISINKLEPSPTLTDLINLKTPRSYKERMNEKKKKKKGRIERERKEKEKRKKEKREEMKE